MLSKRFAIGGCPCLAPIGKQQERPIGGFSQGPIFSHGYVKRRNSDVNKLICQQPIFINSQHANLSLTCLKKCHNLIH